MHAGHKFALHTPHAKCFPCFGQNLPPGMMYQLIRFGRACHVILAYSESQFGTIGIKLRHLNNRYRNPNTEMKALKN